MTHDWLEKARSAHRCGDYAGVLRACDEAPATERARLLAHAARAAALAKLGRSDDALREIGAAVELGARSAELCRLAAEVLAEKKDFDAACDWIDRALGEGRASREMLRLRESVVREMHLFSGMFEHMELCVELEPQWLEARQRLIAWCLDLRLFELAEKHLALAMAAHPSRIGLQLDRALALAETGRAPAAVDALDRALDCGPSVAERLRIARLYVRAGALDRARSALHDACAVAPDVAEVRLQAAFFALWQGDVNAARDFCRGLPGNLPGLTRLHAATAIVEGRFEVALEAAERAVAEDRNDAEALALRAAALYYLGRYAEAEEGARSAAHATTEWLPAAQLIELAGRAGPYATIRRFQTKEIFDLLRPLWREPVVLPGTPADAEARPLLEALEAGLRRLSGNFGAALTYLDPRTGAWSSFALRPPARTACLRVFDWIQARPLDWVAAQMLTLGEQYPGSFFIHTHAAELWLWYGRYDACEAECRKALAITKTEGSRWAWVGLGAALMLQGRLNDALEVFGESCRIESPGPPLLAYRGETRRRCGDLDGAYQDLTETLKGAPTRISAWVNLALIAFARGRESEGRDIYDRLGAQAAQLICDTQRDLKTGTTTAGLGTDPRVATLEHALRVMRGNRSSHRVTYFLADGRARLFPGRALS